MKSMSSSQVLPCVIWVMCSSVYPLDLFCATPSCPSNLNILGMCDALGMCVVIHAIFLHVVLPHACREQIHVLQLVKWPCSAHALTAAGWSWPRSLCQQLWQLPTQPSACQHDLQHITTASDCLQVQPWLLWACPCSSPLQQEQMSC